MRATGGVPTRRSGARFGMSMVLASSMLLGFGGVAHATTAPEGSGTADQQPVGPEQPPAGPEQPPAEPVPADPAPVEPDQGADGPAQVPAPSGHTYVDGFIANGHGAGAATFTPLLGDADHPVPDPPTNEALPVEVDELGPYVFKVSCDPQDRPGVSALALLLGDTFDRHAHSGSRPCIDYNSAHHDGRALDWALNAHDATDRRIGDTVAHWLTENDGEMARRLGIDNFIWNRQVWDRFSGWQNYVGHPHDDHMHFALTWDGAQMNTSWWTGVAVTRPDLGPCEVSGMYAALHQFPRREACPQIDAAPPSTGLARVLPGGTETGLSALQEQLGVPATGVLDGPTRAALLDWQVEHDVPATGLIDDYTHAALQGQTLPELAAGLQAVLPEEWQTTAFTPYLRSTVTQGDTGEAVVVLQDALGTEPDGDFGPKTAEALSEWEESVPLLAAQAGRRGADDPAVVTPLTWTLLERAAHPTVELRDLELAVGSVDESADPEGARAGAEPLLDDDGTPRPVYAGGAVLLLQVLLGVDADGDFGPQTEEAVKAAQEEAGLEPTGVVDGPTWAAIETAAIEADRIEGAPGLQAQREREKAEQAAAQEADAEQARAAAEAEQAQEAFDRSSEDASR